MRTILTMTAIVAGIACIGLTPARAAPQPMTGISSAEAHLGAVEDIGWRRRYGRYGYPAPYAYPPAYGYYPPPAYYAPVYPAYRHYAPYRYYRPYYAPYY